MKKVVVIGGGTAGWIVALFFKKFGKDYDMTIIDSSRVGILGAGEGSTPNLQGVLHDLDINERDFLEKTNTTIKEANEFINWSPNGGSFLHGFDEEYRNILYGYHFDARLAAGYFKELGIKRGIKHVDGNITHFTQKENGDVSIIHLEEGIDIESDFVFDCSGFARLVIGGLYNSEWKSYSEYLKCDSAFAYFLPQEEKLELRSKTRTKSIAMNCGWMWQAPLKHRWGCGYVYNSNFISLENAKLEVEEYLGREIEIVKTFKFNPGSYKKTWINNCVSLGLAGGFLEPLEATSIMTLIFSMHRLAYFGIENVERRDEYNDFVNDMNHQMVLFVKHHYNCGRTDTPFWLDNNNSKLPEDLEEILKNGLRDINTNEELLSRISTNSKSPVFGIKNYRIVQLGHSFKVEKTLI